MKKIVIVLICLLLTPLSAQEQTEAKAALEFAELTGSRLARLRAQLLYSKHGIKWPKTYIKMSDYGLKNNLFGGSALVSDGYSRTARLITGGRAIDETLQLDTINALLSDPAKRTIALKDVEPLEIKSHPWKEMIAELPPHEKASAIYNLVPHDHFVVYFKNGSELANLEEKLQQISETVIQAVPLNIPEGIGSKALQRLGVSGVSGELLFISEDLDFYPGTHYAAISKFKLKETTTSGKVGRYWVAATSPQLFQRVKTVAKGDAQSMGESLDFQYAHAVVDQPRNAFIYLSEAFILKLVSPAHRLNAGRRLAAIDVMTSGQQLVWAYRSVYGKWPTDVSEFAKKDEQTGVTLTKDGSVSHDVWGSITELKALSDIPIEKVTKEEQELYDRFREGYQSYWREFFDPIGIGIRMGNELTFHTIILPLIDNSEYKDLFELASGEKIEFDSLRSPFGNSPLSIHSKVNFEDLFLRAMIGRRHSEKDPDKLAEQKQQVNAEVSRNVAQGEPVDIFSMFGNEGVICVFTPKSGRELDPEKIAALAIELTDVAAFRQLIAHTGENFENSTHQDQTYYKVPFIFGSYFYATYVDNYLCFTGKEEPMLSLCESLSNEPVSGFKGQEALGAAHHMLFRTDFESSDWFGGFLSEYVKKDFLTDRFRYKTGYLGDHRVLEMALEGTSQNVDDLLTPVPKELYGVPFESKAGAITFGGVPLEQVYWRSWASVPEGQISAAQILEELDAWKQVTEPVKNLRWLTATLDFTPEGLSTHLMIRVGEQSGWLANGQPVPDLSDIFAHLQASF